METTINAVGFELDKDQSDLISKKLERIKYADDLIVDLLFRVKEDKKYIYTDDYLLATKDENLILCGIVKRRKDGVFVLENKKQHKSIPLIELKASGVKLINLQNHKIYFAKKNNKTIKK